MFTSTTVLASVELTSSIYRSPIVVSPNTPIREVISQMHRVRSGENATLEANISCAIAIDREKIVGILTGSDVLRLVAQGQPFQDVSMGDIMTHPVVTLSELNFTDYGSLLDLLDRHQIGHLPVVNARQELVGILTKSDLLQAILARQTDKIEGESSFTSEETIAERSRPVIKPIEVAKGSLVVAKSTGCFHCSNADNILNKVATSGILSIHRNLSDRQQVELAMKYQVAAIEAVIDGIGIIEGEWYLYLNQAHLDLFGYRQEELLGNSWKQLYSRAEIDRFERYIFPILERDKAWRGEAVATHKDGSTFTQELSLNLTEEGLLICVCRNVSKRRQSEIALKETQQRLALATKAANVGIWDFNPIEGRLIWDERMLELYGMRADEFEQTYQAWARTVHPQDLAATEQEFQAAIAGEKEFHTEFRVVQRDGDIRFIEAHATILRDDSGTAVRAIGINFDITERKRTEETLLRREIHLKTAQRIGRLGSWEFDVTNQKVTWSEEIFQIFGLSPTSDTFTYEQLLQCLHPDDREHHDRAVRQAIYRGQPYAIECRIYRPNGDLVYSIARGEPLCDASGNVTHLIGTLQDLTEGKLAEQQLHDAKEAAEYANRAKSEFLALMSHEIRTPMNGVLGLTHLALQTDLNPLQQDYLNKIQRSGQSLLHIINDILDFSKIEVGKLELELVPFQLDDIVTGINNTLSLKAAEKNLDLLFEIDDNVPRCLLGDPLRLSQIAINLAANAIKFTDTGSVAIAISTLIPQSETIRLRFEVRDTGIGLTPPQLENLFEAFTQADASTSRKYSGTGLGLAICKRLVTLMGGTIGVNSEAGLGSTFYFELELGYLCQLPEDRPPQDMPNLQGLKCLVVDDNRPLREGLIKVLQSFSFSAFSASSGRIAIDMLHRAIADEEPFDFILMDRCMPKWNGIETIQKMRVEVGTAATPPILMMTAYDREALRAETQGLGIGALLPKPIDRSKLLDAILHVLGYESSGSSGGTEPYRRYHPRNGSPYQVQGLEQLQGARILVVEDHEVNQLIARELLHSVGIIVDIAVNGLEAIAKVRQCSYDLVLMDIRMPEMDGLEATRQIRALVEEGNLQTERFATLPIVAMTAHATDSDLVRSLEAGMNDRVSKPIDPQALFAALIRWIAPYNRCTAKEVVAKEREALPTREGDEAGRVALEATEPPLRALPGFNLEEGLSRLDGNWEIYSHLLKLFYQEYQGFAAQIRSALADGDRVACKDLVHSLKGASGNVGAQKLYGCTIALEGVWQNGSTRPLTEVPELTILLQTLAEALHSVQSLEEDPSARVEEEIELTKTLTSAECDRILALIAQIGSWLESDLVEAIVLLDVLKNEVVGTSLEANCNGLEEELTNFDRTDLDLRRAQQLLLGMKSIISINN